MSLERLRSTWEELGRVDPLWAVLVRPERRDGRWRLDEFLATAAEDIEAVVGQLARWDLDLGKRVLDFGCGVGRLSAALAEHVDEVVGVDIASSMIEGADRINRHPGRVRFVHYDGARLPFPDDSFDSAVSLISIQHSPPAVQLACLVELQRVVRPGGVMVLQIPIGPVRAEPIDATAMRAEIEVLSVPRTLCRSQTGRAVARLRNISTVDWPSHAQLRFGNHWYRDGRAIRWDDGRSDVTSAVAAGADIELALTITAPAEAGEYEVEFDLLQEGVSWWADAGSRCVRVPLTVIDEQAPPAENPEPDDAKPAARGTNRAEMEMYGMDERLVRMLLAHTGCVVRAAVPDAMAGQDWVSRTYYVLVR